MSRKFLPVLVAFTMAATAPAADEAYTLKMYREKEGEVVKKTVTITTEGKVTITVSDKTEATPVKQVDHFVEIAEVVKWPAKAPYPTKLARTFEKFDLTDRTGETVPTALAGMTMVTEVAGDKVTHTVDGKPLSAEQVTTYQTVTRGGSISIAFEWLPSKPVKVGDTWDLDLKKGLEASRVNDNSIDLKKSSFTGKLLKAMKKDGVLWGTVEFEERLALTQLPGGGMSLAVEPGSEMTLKTTVETCLDGTLPGGTVEVAAGLHASAKLPMDGKMTVVITSKGNNTTEPVKKK